jgi:hypothetical protein
VASQSPHKLSRSDAVWKPARGTCYDCLVRPLVSILVAACGLLVACERVCARQEPVPGLDGGSVACVVSTDCPRPANVLVCGNLEDRLRDCVECASTRCVRYIPEPNPGNQACK